MISIFVLKTSLIYLQKAAIPELRHIIKSFWYIDSEQDSTIRREKIIPDGYPELIFHYGSPYRANISGEWFLQENCLIAGQITNHFFLENTGKTGMVGIKFQPWALRELFGIESSEITNTVTPIPGDILLELEEVKSIAISSIEFDAKVCKLEHIFSNYGRKQKNKFQEHEKAVKLIIHTKGQLNLHEVLKEVQLNERSLERYFKSYVGLTPKLFSRIIRFSAIFNLVQQEKFEWTEISFLSGFYDQSHFIKNFKEFTGEEPSTYGFDTHNMANLFLKQS